MKKFLPLFILSASFISLSAIANEAITDSRIQIKSVHPANGRPQYFFKASSDFKYLGINSGRSRREENLAWIFDTSDNKTYPLKTTGLVDPVFIPHTQLMVISSDKASPYNMMFFDLENQAPDDFIKIEPFYVDIESNGLYQSVAVLEQKKDQIEVRVIFQASNFFKKDYTLTRKNNLWTAAVKKDVQPACSNYLFSMGFISREGAYIIGSDLTNLTSAIYRLQDDGACEKVTDFSYITGKGSFSYDSRYVAFHLLSDKVWDGSGFIPTPSGGVVGNIYVYDRDTSRTLPITKYTEGATLYPDFLADGTLVYVFYDADGTVRYVRLDVSDYIK